MGSEIEKGEKGSLWGNKNLMWEFPARGLKNLRRPLSITAKPQREPIPTLGPAPHAYSMQGVQGRKQGCRRSTSTACWRRPSVRGMEDLSHPGSHIARLALTNWMCFMADQNDVQNGWVSGVCVTGWCLSREGNTSFWHWPRGWNWMISDHLPSLAFPYSQSCTYQLVCIQKGDQGHDPARILTATCNLAIDKGRGGGCEFPFKTSPFDVKHLSSTAFYAPELFLCSLVSPLVVNRAGGAASWNQGWDCGPVCALLMKHCVALVVYTPWVCHNCPSLFWWLSSYFLPHEVSHLIKQVLHSFL